ncbi:MAG TPA: MOSC N-terminal beta barrel domain-containing protein [Trinickia sp.]|nr:MOSC N-terminal beta barrel domain-containing protein [Trinickia sp.]
MPSISQLNVYPIKSCAGISRDSVRLTPHGLEYDRNWMVVDLQGRFVTQRTHARLSLVRPSLEGGALTVKGPGMPALALPADAAELANSPMIQATVWKDTVAALDAGDEAARWFSDFLDAPVRLVRFNPGNERTASAKWTGDVAAQVRFADGFPLLVLGEASLGDLNARLAGKGVDPISMNRFRPNLVLAGIEAYEEDFTETLRIEAAGGEVQLRLVKPCTRCPIPTIDQARGAPDPRWPNEPTDTMSAYRADSRVDGAVSFGQNAIVIAGAGDMLTVGQTVDAELRFDA